MMDPALRAYLGSVSLTKEGGALRFDRICKLCGGNAPFFDAVDFQKSCDNTGAARSAIMVEYFRCSRCELIFTDFCDDWTSQDFAELIYNRDYIKVDPEYAGIRPRRTAEELAPSFAGAEDRRILDYGSGSGLFAQELGRRGFAHVESYDPFVHAAPPQGRFDLITCFDVIEHSNRPAHTLAEIMNYLEDDGVALFGQTLQPENIDQLRGDWWYIAPRNGHVTMYSSETMRTYAREQGLRYDEFRNLFALSRPGLSALSRRIIDRRDPLRNHVSIGAPAPDEIDYGAWYHSEPLGGRSFRWTRESEVELGVHSFPEGRVRVSIPYHIPITGEFLRHLSLRIGTMEQPLTAKNGALFAWFDMPDDRARHVVLRTPALVTPASLGVANDDRNLGIAIWCA